MLKELFFLIKGNEDSKLYIFTNSVEGELLYFKSFFANVFKFFRKILALLFKPFFEKKSYELKLKSLIIRDLKLLVFDSVLLPLELKSKEPILFEYRFYGKRHNQFCRVLQILQHNFYLMNFLVA